jgi:hypothetical protein
MEDALVRIPIVCPGCGKELLTEFPAASLAAALLSGDSVRLSARCHCQVWQASGVEREQLRQYLEAANLWDQPRN